MSTSSALRFGTCNWLAPQAEPAQRLHVAKFDDILARPDIG
jgi:hypothetical protein